jgi:hypothetical protein
VDLSNLSVIPEAPRGANPKNWDWRILEGQAARGIKKVVSSDDSAFGSTESTMKDSDGSKVHLLSYSNYAQYSVQV